MLEVEKRLSVMSWNTLFRKYEEQYNPRSSILKKYPNENERINDIVDVIEMYLRPNMIVCLQECSKKLLRALQNRIKTHVIFRRIIRENEYLSEDDRREYLITLTPNTGFSQEKCDIHPSANGYLIVSNSKYRIVNCHLIPQRYAEVKVLEYIKELPNDKMIIIAGDFNESYKKVFLELGDRYTTPKYGVTYKNRKAIDHIIMDFKGQPLIYETKVVKTDFISDHNTIILDIY